MKFLLLVCSATLCAQVNAQTTVFQTDLSTPSSYTVASFPAGDWVVGGNGPQGANSQSMGAINSSTPTDFALFDSDFLGSPGVQQSATITITDYIDVTGFTFAYVCFESYYKHDTGLIQLQVSNDGGATWTTFSVHTNLAQGASTANPSNQLIDVSAVAGNEPGVTIRFSYDGDPGFAWMIDDICMIANNSPIIGLEENEDRSFQVFPNPSNGIFTLDLHKIKGDALVRITDLQGRVVSTQTADPSMLTVNIALNEDPGTYFVTVLHDEGESTQAVVKK